MKTKEPSKESGRLSNKTYPIADSLIMDAVVVSRQYLEYLQLGTRKAILAGVYKAKIFDESGEYIASQG